MPNKRSYCVICANSHAEEDGKIIMSRIFVCRQCNDAVLALHLLTNPIKWLCPHCQGVPGSNCMYCSLRIMIRRASNVQ